MNITEIAERRYTTKAFDSTLKIPGSEVEQIKSLLRNAPSSVNSQPWHFFIASTQEGKSLVAEGMHGFYAYNQPKVLNASHVIVLCAKNTLDEEHLNAVIQQEASDGRFSTPEARTNQDKSRRHYVNLHRNQQMDEREWTEKQVYLTFGALLFAAAALKIDACAMEGFDAVALDQALGLAAKGLHSVAVIALGYRSTEDFNANLPKSRLLAHSVISEI